MKGIVFENKEFKVVSYEKGKEPDYLAIKDPKEQKGNSFEMINGIRMKLHKPPLGYGTYKELTIEFFHEETLIESIVFGNIVALNDLMEFYYNLSEEEIRVRFERVLNKEKKILQSELDELHDKKEKMIRTTNELLKEVEKFKNDFVEGTQKLKDKFNLD